MFYGYVMVKSRYVFIIFPSFNLSILSRFVFHSKLFL